MDQKPLRDKLTELHAELEQTESVDDETRQSLGELKDHIQGLLDQPAEDATPHYRPLSERLRGDVSRFEATHPRLTAAMERAIDALVQMGV
jgi:Domain of unknown function (DUF4404)